MRRKVNRTDTLEMILILTSDLSVYLLFPHTSQDLTPVVQGKPRCQQSKGPIESLLYNTAFSISVEGKENQMNEVGGGNKTESLMPSSHFIEIWG